MYTDYGEKTDTVLKLFEVSIKKEVVVMYFR